MLFEQYENKITVYALAGPLFRLVCRQNEIMTIASNRMQIAHITHRYRYSTDTDTDTDATLPAVADTPLWAICQLQYFDV